MKADITNRSLQKAGLLVRPVYLKCLEGICRSEPVTTEALAQRLGLPILVVESVCGILQKRQLVKLLRGGWVTCFLGKDLNNEIGRQRMAIDAAENTTHLLQYGKSAHTVSLTRELGIGRQTNAPRAEHLISLERDLPSLRRAVCKVIAISVVRHPSLPTATPVTAIGQASQFAQSLFLQTQQLSVRGTVTRIELYEPQPSQLLLNLSPEPLCLTGDTWDQSSR